MDNKRTIGLEAWRKAVSTAVQELTEAFPGKYIDYAGTIPQDDTWPRYFCTPLNTTCFAATGGDGVHYSILEISTDIQPVVMTVPMNFGPSIRDYNRILAENLSEFLSLGYYNGWFALEQCCYAPEAAISYFAGEDPNEDYQSGRGKLFARKMSRLLGYGHLPLNQKRLDALDALYFDRLQFGQQFIDQINRARNHENLP